ncbi:MAG: YvcK family protein [Bacteroidetes bacterium]|nr:YvcK family protein [Bacteroidota bacterium]
MINVVSFNGGRGAKNLIPALIDIDGVNLTSIVNAYDDGKSTGVIRNFFRMLGPSDIRKVQEAMVPRDLPDYDAVLKTYDYRYPVGKPREEILQELTLFANDASQGLSGIYFQSKTIRESLQVFIRHLLNAIALIEQAEAKQFSFDDCSIMNLIYAGAHLHFGHNFEAATLFIDKLFQLSGNVLPTSNENRKLIAIREDGTLLLSEAEIVELRSNSRIKKIYLVDEYPSKAEMDKMTPAAAEAYFDIIAKQVGATPKVLQTIQEADVIIYSAGTQHSSLYPSYMTAGITDTIVANKAALKIFITNIGEDYETPSYDANDFIEGAIRYMCMGSEQQIAASDLITFALVNNRRTTNLDENYVQYDSERLATIGCGIMIDGYEDVKNPGKHDGAFLSRLILELYEKRMNLSGK